MLYIIQSGRKVVELEVYIHVYMQVSSRALAIKYTTVYSIYAPYKTHYDLIVFVGHGASTCQFYVIQTVCVYMPNLRCQGNY